MGLPHPDLQKRRLKRLQNEQTKCLSQGSGLAIKKFSQSKKSDVAKKGQEVSHVPDNNRKRVSASIEVESNKVSKNLKICGEKGDDIDKTMVFPRARKGRMRFDKSTSNLSSSSTISSQFNVGKAR